HNYYTDDDSPVVDAGNPTDPHPPGTGEQVDIGYIEQGRAAYYVDDDYCADCLNDGLTWGVDAYDNIQQALDEAGDEQIGFGGEAAGDVTCRIYRSDDVGQQIGRSSALATGTDEVISALDVAGRGLVTDVNLHSLRGTHSRVSDLDLILESPSGTMVRLLTPLGCDQADFDLNFDDEAAPGSPPCPPDDGGTYQPVQALSKLDGDNSDGTWLLHVRDSVPPSSPGGSDGEGGTLDAWGLEICARDLPPILTVGVGPGTYYEAVRVPSYVRLAGIGGDQATVDASGLGTAVTLDGVVQAEISGLALRGDGSSAGVRVRGGSNQVLIDRCLVHHTLRGLVFEQGGTGTATFNTLVGESTSPADAYGIQANGTGSQVVAENNILHNYRYGLYQDADGNIYSDYNLLAGNTSNYGAGIFHGEHDRTAGSPGFTGGNYYLSTSSPAVDSASPHEVVPPGGGTRADMGYHELIALPATLFLGREGVSTAMGNSGLARVESAVVPVTDLYSAASETTPAAWDTVYDDPDHEQTKATWLLSNTPAAEGLHRIYSRAEDAVGNRPGDGVDWYVGAFVADGSAPAVSWLAPAPGNVATEVELRAQAWDEAVGQFSVETVQFEVDGSPVPAQWAAEPWDPASGLPRTFRAWASLSLASNPTIVAVAYDQAGNRGESLPLVLNVISPAAPDSTPPALTVSGPLSGTMVQPPVLFQGTASDGGGSGLESVQVSLDNGVTWLPAAVSGGNWSLAWNPPWRQDYVTYPALVRAMDKAGNTTSQAVTIALDNVPPTLNTAIPNGRTRFYDLNNNRYIYPNQHLDYPTQVRIGVGWPWDGSDSDGSSLRYQYIVDQNADTPPSLVGPWDPEPSTSPEEWFLLPGEWYVHIYYRDQADNIAIHHYGPWHMGNFGDLVTQCNDRRQSIDLDGLVDVERHEWADHEFLDDDERGMGQGYERQSLYAAWDGEAFYAAWQGARWDVDGTMWVYLDRETSSGDSGTDHTVTYPYKTLPFLANYAIGVDGEGNGTGYYASGGSWHQSSWIEFAHGNSGGTEVRFPWEIPLNTVMDVRMLAYAEDNDGQVWSAFPTTNPLEGDWNDYYHWNTLCNILYGINVNQPTYTSLYLELASEVAPEAAVGPGTVLTYYLGLGNLEEVTSTISTLVISATDALQFDSQFGGTCDICPPLGDEWTLLVPPIPPDVTYNITLTGQLTDVLTGLSDFTASAALGLAGQTRSVVSITQQLDSLAPTLDVTLGPNRTLCSGPQTIRGSACDLANPLQTLCTGGGVDLVEYSLDGGGTWLSANGTAHWSATIDVPTGGPTFDLWLRASDVFGQVSQELFTFNLDGGPPTVTLDLPPYLTGAYAQVGGLAADGESAVDTVEVQMGDDTAPWNAGQVYAPDDGVQKWRYSLALPAVDGEDRLFRARAT
ncbi:MAG: proprotein convertase P-domain-containing protein, partial [Anaerolineae bacterium]